MKTRIKYLLIAMFVAATSFAQSLQNGSTATSHSQNVEFQTATENSLAAVSERNFSSMSEMYVINVYSADESMGYTYGGGTYNEGDYAYIYASAYEGYLFSHWNDGNTEQYRQIQVTGTATYIAYFEVDTRPTYTISVYSADESMGTVRGSGEYHEGTYAYIEAIPNNGYVFSHWNDEDESYSYRSVYVEGDASYTAYFEVDTRPAYTISVYSADENMGYTYGGGEYREGEYAYIEAYPRDGYVFSHWSDEDESYEYSSSSYRSVYVEGDATYIAYFEVDTRPTYTISVYSADESMGTVYGGGEYREGQYAYIEANPRNGYVFSHWSDGNTEQYRDIQVTGPATYIAYFEGNDNPTYTISVYSANENMGTVDGGGEYYKYDYAYIYASAYEGYLFSHWNDGNTERSRRILVTEDASYTAYFEIDTRPLYNIYVYSANENEGTVYGGGEYHEGDYIYIYANPQNGYVFSYWSDGSTEQYRGIYVTGDATYTAYFEIDTRPTYTISVYSADESMGTVRGGGEYHEGTFAYIEAIPNDGYVFSHWSDEDESYEYSSSSYRSVYVEGDATYTAYFEVDTRPTHTISVYSADESMGTVEGSGQYHEGSYIEIYAYPNDGYSFSRWNDGNTEQYREIYVTGDADYTAYFEVDTRPTHTISVYSADESMGTVEGSGQYHEGSYIEIHAYPNSGYTFLRWNDGSTEQYREIYVTGDATYTAYFETDTRPTYTVSVYSADESMGTVNGGGEYHEGAYTYIKAIPFTGYYFTEWNDGNTEINRRIEVNEDAVYYAYFEIEQNSNPSYTIYVYSDNTDMGTVSGAGTYDDGDVISITATANRGHRFVSWNDGNTEAIRTIVVTGYEVYIAYFVEDAFHLVTVSSDEARGYVTGGGSYRYGEVVEIEAIPNAGFRFVGWSDNNTDNPRNITVTDDVEYTALFESNDILGIDDDMMSNICIYPNPAVSIVNITSPDEISAIEIMTISGKIVKQIEANGNTAVCNVEDLSNGIYVVRISTKADITIIRKFIKE